MKISNIVALLLAVFVTGVSSQTSNRAAFMSGKNGIGYRLPGGVGYATNYYNATNFANQIKDLPIDYVIIGLSSGAYGDRYLAPHSVLTNLTRGSTPIRHNGTWPAGDFTIEDYPEVDVFDEILTAMASINVSVIAYMAAQGPAMLKAGETAAYDFGNKSLYVDSCAECPDLTGNPGCDCAPSVWKWKNWVDNNPTFSSSDDAMLRKAYAEVIVREYAQRYENRIAGWWFDQGDADHANASRIETIVHEYNPDAAIAWNNGNKVPLRNNNPGVEDFTFGHITPLKSGSNPPDGCYNYGMVLSAESSQNGYVYSDFDTYKSNVELVHNGWKTYDYSQKTDASDRPDQFVYNNTSSHASLAHVFMPLNSAWNNGGIVWDTRQGAEWMKRVTDAGGAFTWNVARSGCAGCDTNIQNGIANQDEINAPDLTFLQEVYNLKNTITEYTYTDTNCKCCTTSTSISQYDWGCLETVGTPDACDATMGLESTLDTYAPTPVPEVTLPPKPQCDADDDSTVWSIVLLSGKTKSCSGAWIYSGTDSYARCELAGTDGVNGYEACPYACGCCSTNPRNEVNTDAYEKCPNLATDAPSVSSQPSDIPSISPSLSSQPSDVPSILPSVSSQPSDVPSISPSLSSQPSNVPSISSSLSSQPNLPASPPTPSPASPPTSSPRPSSASPPTSPPTPSPASPPTSPPTPSSASPPTSPPTPSPTSPTEESNNTKVLSISVEADVKASNVSQACYIATSTMEKVGVMSLNQTCRACNSEFETTCTEKGTSNVSGNRRLVGDETVFKLDISLVMKLEAESGYDLPSTSLLESFEDEDIVNEASEQLGYGADAFSSVAAEQVHDMNFDISFESYLTDIEFSDSRSTGELLFFFNISDKPDEIMLFYKDCKTSAAKKSIELVDTTRSDYQSSTNHDLLQAMIDLKQDTLQSDTNIWTLDSATNNGKLEFCMRVDLYATPQKITSVNFFETIVTVLVDMTKGFDMLDISTNRDAADESSQDVTLNYTLNAYQCTSATSGEQPVTMSQGSALGICIDLPEDITGVTFKQVLTLSLNQTGGGSTSPITNGSPDGLSTMDCTYSAGRRCFVKTMVTSAFFGVDANNANIVADGKVELQFGRRRRLVAAVRSLPSSGPQDEENADDDAKAFEVVIATRNVLVREDDSIEKTSSSRKSTRSTGAAVSWTVGLVALLVGCLWVIIYLHRRRENKEEMMEVMTRLDSSNTTMMEQKIISSMS